MVRDKILNKIRESGLVFINIANFKKIADIKSDNTAYKTVERMVKHGLLKRLKKDLYVPVFSSPTDFEIANHVYTPSYISLESALTFYGIIPEFTYGVTSLTTRKSKRMMVLGKEFEYIHISNRYFFDYEKRGNFWIATPEKALIDTFYLISKGFRKLDLDRLDITKISKKRFYKITTNIRYLPFANIIKEVKI